MEINTHITKHWRPLGWTNPYKHSDSVQAWDISEGYWDVSDEEWEAFENGADAMVDALAKQTATSEVEMEGGKMDVRQVCERGCYNKGHCPRCGRSANYQGIGRCVSKDARFGNWEGHPAIYFWCEHCERMFKVRARE